LDREIDQGQIREIVIDTNISYSYRHVLDSRIFFSLGQLAQTGVCVLISDIFTREIKRHIANAAAEHRAC
jgi:hypothetical protein